jgi:dihydroneopterin aldolase
MEADPADKPRPASAGSAFEQAPLRDRIFVRDFVLPVSIGAYRHERAAPQKVRFDVAVEALRTRGKSPGMEQVFSYDLLTDGIRALAAEGHVEFVETLADRIAALALRHQRVKRVTVRVEKLELGPGGVGVEIDVERPGTEAEVAALLAILDGSAP